jgi:hypothetical protein
MFCLIVRLMLHSSSWRRPSGALAHLWGLLTALVERQDRWACGLVRTSERSAVTAVGDETFRRGIASGAAHASSPNSDCR